MRHFTPIVVLVEPRHPGNVGAVCRAMANFGVSQLRLVKSCDPFHPDAVKFSVGARPLLGQAEHFPDLAAALADVHHSVALTRRTGRLRGNLLPLEELSQRFQSVASQSRVAFVFGREDRGLTTQEVALCSQAATIETTDETGSLNLAQAVVVTLYELSRRQDRVGIVQRDQPTHDQFEPLFQQLDELVHRVGYVNPSRPEVIPTMLRRLLHQAAPDVAELNQLRGLINRLSESVQDWPGRRRG
ncbi:RNA methyltransferase [uncultured Desulfuromonas sp.]|uniref:RNA methyltransferase n=1 Tax=uncultured Desulfuromonas sp. TaxID=181013 RepID=UPI002AAB0C4C|nr:RNA methyltransferase [uncultured Desulfuromonas sp.]